MSLPRNQADVAAQAAGTTAESHAIVVGGTDANNLVTQFLTDSSGKMEVTGGASNIPTLDASTGATNSTAPSFATQVGAQDGTGKLQALKVDVSGNLLVSGGTGGGGSDTQYADGTTQATPTGTAALAKNPSNILHTLAVDASGNLKVAEQAALPAGTNVIGHVIADSGSTTAVTGNVTAVQATGTNLHVVVDSAPTTAVTGTFFQATQPVSASALPLPSGASTAAKQPALGTAGAASADVISVQGVASMTPLKVDASATTQPVSGTLTVQQSTAANLKVDISGTAANATAIKVDGSAVTQPVSGNVAILGHGAILNGQQAVTATAAALASNACKKVAVNSLSANTLNIYVGATGVTTSTGYELAPGTSISLDVTNTNLIFVIASGTGASVSWIATN